ESASSGGRHFQRIRRNVSRSDVETVADANVARAGNRAGRKLDDRVRAPRCRNAPWTHLTHHLQHDAVSIDEDDIDRKLHERGMYRKARRDNERSRRIEMIAAEQLPTTGRAVARDQALPGDA